MEREYVDRSTSCSEERPVAVLCQSERQLSYIADEDFCSFLNFHHCRDLELM